MFNSFSPAHFSIPPGLFPPQGLPFVVPSLIPCSLCLIFTSFGALAALSSCGNIYCWVCIQFALLSYKLCAKPRSVQTSPLLSEKGHQSDGMLGARCILCRASDLMSDCFPVINLWPLTCSLGTGHLYLSPGWWDGGEGGVTVVWVMVFSLPFCQSGDMSSSHLLMDPHFTDVNQK